MAHACWCGYTADPRCPPRSKPGSDAKKVSALQAAWSNTDYDDLRPCCT